jgi:hypothetical protein
LLPETAFVLEEDDDLLVRMLGFDLGDLLGNLFLKSDMATGSDFLCFGRGTSHS